VEKSRKFSENLISYLKKSLAFLKKVSILPVKKELKSLEDIVKSSNKYFSCQTQNYFL